MKSSSILLFTLALMAASVSPRAMSQNNCVSFNGTSGYITTDSSSALNTNTVTVEAWIKPNSTSSDQDVIRLRGATNNDGCEIQLITGGTLRANAYLGGWSEVDYGTHIVDGNWHHVACVVSGTTLSLYVDGSLQGTDVTGSTDLDYGQEVILFIGKHPTNPSNLFYSGLIDEVRISNVVRYSGASFTLPCAPFVADGNTLLLYHFNESSGTSTADASGNGITGTLNGGVPFVASSVPLYSGGSGTSGDPYLISNTAGLQRLANDVNGGNYEGGVYFRQTDTIDCASGTLTQIGSEGGGKIFQGHYDGNGNVIKNFSLTGFAQGSGLFGFVQNGGSIQNLGIVNANISNGSPGTGALVGWGGTGTIQNCYASGGTVTGSSFVGGLIGENSYLSISNCYATGTTVTGDDQVGGFIGYTEAGSTSDCYARCTVTLSTSNGRIGGFVGGDYATVTRCYSTGTVSIGTQSGGFAGEASVSATSCFWDTTTSGMTSSATGTGKSTAQMKTQSTFADSGWDFTTTWEMMGTNYPRLQANRDAALPVELASFTASTDAEGVTLQWSTVSETNTLGYYVERGATKTGSYSVVSGLIAGAGTSLAQHNYSFVDKTVSAGTYYYRLHEIDKDGSGEYSNVIMVDVAAAVLGVRQEPGTPKAFTLQQNYPNPFNPTTDIKFAVKDAGFTTLKVYNTIGQEVATLVKGMMQPGYYVATWNANATTSGVYFYRLQSGSNVSVQRMLLVK